MARVQTIANIRGEIAKDMARIPILNAVPCEGIFNEFTFTLL
jgi:hypothetical protein